MFKNRNLFLALFIGFSTVPCLWAGKVTAGPNDTVVPNQLIVKLQTGASINQILAPIVPQAIVSLVSSRLNSYLLQLPPGIQSIISKALAALPYWSSMWSRTDPRRSTSALRTTLTMHRSGR